MSNGLLEVGSLSILGAIAIAVIAIHYRFNRRHPAVFLMPKVVLILAVGAAQGYWSATVPLIIALANLCWSETTHIGPQTITNQATRQRL